MHFSTLLPAAGLARIAVAGYSVQDDYLQGDFFSKFSYFDGGDPTHGFVVYDGAAAGLTSESGGVPWIGVDSNTSPTPGGRTSIRLTSTATYNKALVVIDLEHMPEGCGTWPAFWMVGPNWPAGGEIDIIEGVNSNTANQMTLHTSPGCAVSSSDGARSSLLSQDCDATINGNTGCGFRASAANSYGSGFNANNGGVYATEWTSAAINIWFFPRGAIPSDVLGDSPDPTGWNTPDATWAGSGCDWGSAFSDMSLVFDTTFCGDWAGNVFASDPVCGQFGSCNDYVSNNPGAFANAFWSVNALKVYTTDGQPPPPKAASPHTTPAASPTSSPVAPPPSPVAPSPTPPAQSPVTPSPVAPSSTPAAPSSTSVAPFPSPHAPPPSPANPSPPPIAPSPTPPAPPPSPAVPSSTSVAPSPSPVAPSPPPVVAPSASAAPSPTPPAPAPSPVDPSPSPVAPTCTLACPTPGLSICSANGKEIGTCDTNNLAVMRPVAHGTRCVNGYQVFADTNPQAVNVPGRRRKHLDAHAKRMSF